MARAVLLDLFCCQGGAAMGYHRAGFDVVGVDIAPQPRYPFEFVQGDALEFLAAEGHRFDAVHASPPCQGYSKTFRVRKNDHVRLIGPTRDLLRRLDVPWVIENVEDAKAEMQAPVTLCGTMFGLRTYRHRLFEVGNVPGLLLPNHRRHVFPTVKMGRPLTAGDWYHAVGNFSNVPYVRADMGVDWMTRDGIRECVPPAYTELIGTNLVMAWA